MRSFQEYIDREAEGSSLIEVPPTIKTAVAGGHIFIRIDSANGPALVGLEARNRETYSSIEPQDFRKAGTGYICRDLVGAAPYSIPLTREDREQWMEEGRNVTRSLPLYTICVNELGWHLVRRVFVEEALFS